MRACVDLRDVRIRSEEADSRKTVKLAGSQETGSMVVSCPAQRRGGAALPSNSQQNGAGTKSHSADSRRRHCRPGERYRP